MEFHACDICNNILKDKFYMLVVNCINKSDYEEGDKEPITLEDFFQKLNEYGSRQRKKVKYYEICPECYEVLNHLFKLRLREIKKMKKEIERIYNEPYKLDQKKKKSNSKRKKK
jgi:hypothetical protein